MEKSKIDTKENKEVFSTKEELIQDSLRQAIVLKPVQQNGRLKSVGATISVDVDTLFELMERGYLQEKK